MKRLQSLIPIFGIAVASLFGLASCGDNSVTCGEGTHAEGGMCLPEATCGTGTIEGPDGSCVPDGSVVCPQGTVFTDGQCQIDDSVCAEGTVLVMGQCVPLDDTLHADLEERAEPNDDPASPAGMLTIGAVDTATTIHGCVNPADAGGDVDFDYWMVNTTSAATIEVTADGVHGLVAGFLMVNGDPALASTLANWQRFGINLTGDTAKRQVYLPAAGTYLLAMTDSRSLFFDDGATGGPDACYFTTIKHIATPAPVALMGGHIAATDSGQVKLYSFNPATTGRILNIEQSSAAAAMDPAFMLLRGPQIASVNSTTHGYTAGGLNMGETVTVVSDMRYNYATTPQPYAYDAIDIAGQALPTNGPITLTKHNGATPAASYADFNYLYFDVVGNGSIVNFNVIGTTTAAVPAPLPLDFVIVRRDVRSNTDRTLFDAFTVINGFGGTGLTGGFANQFVRFLQPGRYYMIVQDPLGTSNETYTVTSSVVPAPTTAVTLGTPLAAQVLPANGNAFHTLDLTNPIWVQFGVTGSNFPAGTATARLALYDLAGQGWMSASGNYVATQSSTLNADGSNPFGRILANDTRDFIVRVEAVGTPLANPTYTLDIKNRDFVNLGTLVPGTPITRMGLDDVPAATGAAAFGVKRFFVTGGVANTLAALITPTIATNDIDIRRIDASEAQVSLVNAAGVGAAETLATNFLFLPTNWVAFEVRNRTLVTNTNLNLALTSVAAPYQVAIANTVWNDACTGPGSAVLGTNQDDELLAKRAFPAGWNISVLGNAATHYIIGANGFIVLGGMALVNPACSFGCYANTAIPNAGVPNGFVASHWDDYFATTICVKEEATKVTVQWVGGEYFDGVVPGTKIATQVVFNMNGARNSVYKAAPDHAATGAFATVGLENALGTAGLQLGFNTALGLAGKTLTLTPAP